MSVGFVIVTHGQIGESIIHAAEFILGHSLNEIGRISVRQSGSEMPNVEFIRSTIASADEGDGVLVMTDLAFASPSNIVEQVLEESHARVVSGVNLSMLLRAWNYRSESLESLAERAYEGGIRGIEIRK